MSFDTVPPPAHPSISRKTVLALLAEQAPQFADLELGKHYEGWDCAMYRLGPELAVRLPRTEHAVRFLSAETLWLPQLSVGWDFRFPHFVAAGGPGAGYPWPWAIVTWLPGDTAVKVPLLESAAGDLGRGLAQVHAIAPPEAPYNDEQSIPMAARDAKVRERIGLLAKVTTVGGETLNPEAAASLWEEALQAPEPAREDFVWSHGDLHGGNVLSIEGRFGGIADWGSMAACDPATDLGFVHALTSRAGVAAALEEYGKATGRVDDAFVARMRGIGLAKCVGIAMNPKSATKAMGWRGLVALGVAV